MSNVIFSMKSCLGRWMASCIVAWDLVRPPTESEAIWDAYYARQDAVAEHNRAMRAALEEGGRLRRESLYSSPLSSPLKPGGHTPEAHEGLFQSPCEGR